MEFHALRGVVILGVLAATVAAQPSTPQIDLTHGYPFHQARTVVSDGDGANAVIYEAAGAGIFVLNGGAAHPTLKSGVANELRAGGWVHDLELTPDHLYAASHRAGLTRFNRASTNPDPDWISSKIPILLGDAWSVDVATRIGDDDMIFVGTNDDFYSYGAGGGVLRLVRADTAPPLAPPTIIASVSLDAPILALESLVEGNTVTLLVGTACRESSGVNEAVVRYDFDISSGFPISIPTPTDTWSPTIGGSRAPAFIRDIEIDPVEESAYIADFANGIYKIDIGASSLSDATGSWPISPPVNARNHFDTVAYHDGPLGSILAVGRGPEFAVETVHWGECTFPTPCDSGDRSKALRVGVSLYDVSSGSPVELATLASSEILALGVDTFERGGKLIVPTASLQAGLLSLEYDFQTDRLTIAGRWNVGDDVPTGQFDDLLVLGNTAFAAVESGLAAFDITESGGAPSATLFENPVDVSAGNAVVLAGFEADAGFPTTVFGSALNSGVNLYEIQGDGPTAQIINRGLFLAGEQNPQQGARTYSVAALPPSETPDGFPWLIAINSRDSATASQNCSDRSAVNAAVRIFRVDVNGNGEIDPMNICELGAYAPLRCEEDPLNPGTYIDTPATGSFVGGHGFMVGNDLRVLVGYSPIAEDSGLIETGAGMVFLTFEFAEAGEGNGDDALVLKLDEQGAPLVTKVPAVTNAVDGRSALVQFRLSHGIVTASLGCNGVATFSLSEVLLDAYPPTGVLSPTAFMDSEVGPDNNLYCTAMDGRIFVFDPTDLSAPIAIVETPGQAAFLEPATSTVPAPPGESQPAAFYLNDFRSGIYRLQFLENP